MAVLLGHIVDAVVPTMNTSALEMPAHWEGFGLSEVCLFALALLFTLSLVRCGPRGFAGEIFNLAGGDSHGDHDDADEDCCDGTPAGGDSHGDHDHADEECCDCTQPV
jgi:hypothetical protein